VRRAFPVCILAIILAVPFALGQKASQESDEYFKSDKVLHLEIEIGPKEMDSLRREPRKYVKATLKLDGKVVGTDVAIHVKGAAGSSRGIDDKPGLTLNMDKFVDGQRFKGMDKFHLANSVQDASYVQEMICGELMRAAGVPASRVHHVTVSINGKKKGLYYLKEGYDNFFLERHFGSDKGNFYDGGFLRDIDQDLQLLSGKDDVKDRTDLKALVAACKERDPAARFAKLEKLLDMDKFISYLVVEGITCDWDGYPRNRNNYRVYHDAKTDKIIFIPSGMDQMFGNPGEPILPGYQGLVARAVIETPEGKKRYFARMAEVMKTCYDVGTLTKRIDRREARLTPALTAVDPGAGRDYKNQANRMRELLKARAKSVEEQLGRLPK